MPDNQSFALFLSAAFLLAVTPGPGIFYVLTRSLKGGRWEGYASAGGTAIGGLIHVIGAALGLSALLMSSALAFNIIKYLGAAYLIYLGIRTLLRPDDMTLEDNTGTRNNRQAFYQGITTEALNPKTALFYLAFIPQFINPSAPVMPQFILLGGVSIFLNGGVDVIVASLAGTIGTLLKRHLLLRRIQRWFTGSSLILLGAYAGLTGSGERTSK